MTVAIIVGCTTTEVKETAPGSGVYSTNVVVDPKFETALTTVKAVNTATAPLNPFSPLVEITLGAIAAGATWFAKRKNDQNAQNALLLKTVIQGVENAATPAVKQAIQDHASRIGVEGELGTTVQQVNSGQL